MPFAVVKTSLLFRPWNSSKIDKAYTPYGCNISWNLLIDVIPWQTVDSQWLIITCWGKSRSQHSQKVHQHVMTQGNHKKPSLDVQLGFVLSRPQDLEVFTRPVGRPQQNPNGMRVGWGGVKPTRFGQVYHKRWEIFKLNVLAGPNYAISWFPLLLSLQRLKRWWSCRNMHVSCLFLICLIISDLWFVWKLPKIRSFWTRCRDRQQKVCHAIQPEKQQHLH